jgi:hypothetical protein
MTPTAHPPEQNRADSRAQPQDILGDSNDFLVALQHPQRIGSEVEVHGVRGQIVEQITYEEYVMTWMYKGCPSEGVSLFPTVYYRCKMLSDVGGKFRRDWETEVRGDGPNT